MQQNPVSQAMLRHAMGKIPQIPKPTTADNGKTLGVENGAYALVEGGGGGGGMVESYMFLEL